MSFQNDRITSIPAPLPLDYDRQYSFTNWETNNPGVPYPASALEAEFNAIQQAVDETQARLRLIQDDDGSVLNESVGNDQLKSEVLIGVNAPTNWATTTSYAVSDTVFQSNVWYYCLVAHVSDPSSFATDLGAGKWRELLDLTTVITVEAQNWANYPEDSLVPEGDLVDDYSALHHANKAAASAAAAASSAADAAADAAVVPAPSGGSANDLLRRNGAGTAYELFTPTAEAATATADTLALRDGSGRMKAADPAAADDVATQGWTEAQVTAAKAAAETDETDDTGYVTPKQLNRQIARKACPGAASFTTTSLTTITGTYSIVVATGTISGLSASVTLYPGDYVYLNYTTGTGTSGWKQVVTGGAGVTSFTVLDGAGTHSGNCEIYIPSTVSTDGLATSVFTDNTGVTVRINASEDIDGIRYGVGTGAIYSGAGRNGTTPLFAKGYFQYVQMINTSGTAVVATDAHVLVI